MAPVPSLCVGDKRRQPDNTNSSYCIAKFVKAQLTVLKLGAQVMSKRGHGA